MSVTLSRALGDRAELVADLHVGDEPRGRAANRSRPRSTRRCDRGPRRCSAGARSAVLRRPCATSRDRHARSRGSGRRTARRPRPPSRPGATRARRSRRRRSSSSARRRCSVWVLPQHVAGADRLREQPALAAHVLADPGQRIARLHHRLLRVRQLHRARDPGRRTDTAAGRSASPTTTPRRSSGSRVERIVVAVGRARNAGTSRWTTPRCGYGASTAPGCRSAGAPPRWSPRSARVDGVPVQVSVIALLPHQFTSSRDSGTPRPPGAAGATTASRTAARRASPASGTGASRAPR